MHDALPKLQPRLANHLKAQPDLENTMVDSGRIFVSFLSVMQGVMLIGEDSHFVVALLLVGLL